jgi:hypothetical protein
MMPSTGNEKHHAIAVTNGNIIVAASVFPLILRTAAAVPWNKPERIHDETQHDE